MYRPVPVVFCGPSGVGKSTLVKRLQLEFPTTFGFSVSHTTRKPRLGEVSGIDYHFVSREDMLKAINSGEFIEYAEFSGNLYGTSKKAVEDVQSKGKMCILDIDVQGVKQIKLTDLSPRLIFIQPPTLDSLRTRLVNRGTETAESLQKRLSVAEAEMAYGVGHGNFDLIIINDVIEVAYSKLRDFLLPDITSLQEFLKKKAATETGSGDRN